MNFEDKEKIKMKGCKYCGTFQHLTIDHKQPKILGGTEDKKNLQCLCFHCNIMKSQIPHKVLQNLFAWYEETIRGKTKWGKRILKVSGKELPELDNNRK